MAMDRSVIGAASAPQTFDVERGAIRRFAEAIGDDTPACRAGDVAPPTFPTTFRVSVPGAGYNPAHVLHAGEEYTFERPLRAGDRVVCVRRIADLYEREGRSGTLTFLVSEMEGRSPEGERIFQARQTIILREVG